jgi:hypothetical protein
MKRVIRLANPHQARAENLFFAEGEAAKAERRHIDSNPYPAYSEPYWQWQNGWFTAGADRPGSWRQRLRILIGWNSRPGLKQGECGASRIRRP